MTKLLFYVWRYWSEIRAQTGDSSSTKNNFAWHVLHDCAMIMSFCIACTRTDGSSESTHAPMVLGNYAQNVETKPHMLVHAHLVLSSLSVSVCHTTRRTDQWARPHICTRYADRGKLLKRIAYASSVYCIINYKTVMVIISLQHANSYLKKNRKT